jgi:ElaB/YqjD/DUF883 family membrane-anchored ribosome-binding protein
MSQDAETKTADEIREEIDQTREQLGDTVEALGSKADVKGQARAKIDGVKEGLRQKAEDLSGKAKSTTPQSALSGGQALMAKARENPAPAAIAALLVGLLLRRLTRR